MAHGQLICGRGMTAGGGGGVLQWYPTLHQRLSESHCSAGVRIFMDRENVGASWSCTYKRIVGHFTSQHPVCETFQ